MAPVFRKILIANRGEIACRVITTARRLGIATVAVYSEADARARHVAMADEAWPIGPAPARQSYLAMDKILDVARRSGAKAIHPGYGFLSENAAFAEACQQAGIVFIGPPPEAIRAMGSKAEAKRLMERSGIRLVPGYHGDAQDLPILAEASARIGYPVLVKASAGGGGKGMRIVDRPESLAAAVAGAQREALSSFSDDRVLIEKYLVRPRHIEIQVFADTHGNVVSLFERDCSIQRRHQKIIEEAPAPGMDASRRRSMGEAAIAAARAVGYVGAGTVEFIVEHDAFYFMEMNTRLQVEHPVTEMVTGQDLVEWQFRVAAGEQLKFLQDQLCINGHAIEVRVYAEDPHRDFLPSVGALAHLRQPPENAVVRVDTGVREGDRITQNYDPMIAKLIVWGQDRAAALRRMEHALGEYQIVGVRTNLDLLRAIVAHPAFLRAELDTGFLARYPDVLAEPPSEATDTLVWAAAVLAVLRHWGVVARGKQSANAWSPWEVADAWRMNGIGYQDIVLRRGEAIVTIRAHPQTAGYRLDLPSGSVSAEADDETSLRLEGVVRNVPVVRQGAKLTVIVEGRNFEVEHVDPLAPPAAATAAENYVIAPLPARIVRVLVKPGDAVQRGAALLVLEAMKMEVILSAPKDSVVERVHGAVDDMVEEGSELVTFVGGNPA